MFKQNKKVIIITSILCLLPIFIGIVLWGQLPDTIATHFDSSGSPNGWSSKPFAVFALPCIMTALHLFSIFVIHADPKRANIGGKILGSIYWICPIVSWIVAITVYGAAMNIPFNPSTLSCVIIGLVFVIVGNYLPKCKQNYTVGIKLPWTLADEENWNRTHRIGGWIFILSGILMLVLFFLRLTKWIFIPIFLSIGIPSIYSYLYYRKHKDL